MTAGESESLLETTTFSTLSPMISCGTQGKGSVSNCESSKNRSPAVTNLHSSGQALKVGDFLLTGSLLLVGLLQLQPFLGNTDHLLAIEFLKTSEGIEIRAVKQTDQSLLRRATYLELSDGVLVNRVDKEKDLESLLLQHLKEWRLLDSRHRLSRQVVDRLLDFRHSSDVVLERSQLFHRLGGVESEELGKLDTVRGVFVAPELNTIKFRGTESISICRAVAQSKKNNPHLEVLAEGFVELGVVVLVLCDLGNELHSLLDDVLLDKKRTKKRDRGIHC